MAKEPISEEDVIKQIAPLSKSLQKSAKELWGMFVKRYLAKGLAEIFLAVFINVVAYMFLWQDHKYWVLLPLGIGGVLIYDAIQLIVNPQYFAMHDVIYKLKTEKVLS